MNATNVDYYIVGFKSDGSRAAGKICIFDPIKHPDKLKAEAEKMKADNADHCDSKSCYHRRLYEPAGK